MKTINPPTHGPVLPGRRPSVRRTMARRCPFARKRPEALDLPTRLSVACVPTRLTLGIAQREECSS